MKEYRFMRDVDLLTLQGEVNQKARVGWRVIAYGHDGSAYSVCMERDAPAGKEAQ